MLSVRFLLTFIVIAIIAVGIVLFKGSLFTQLSDPELNSKNVWTESAGTEEGDSGALLLATAETGIVSGERPLNGPAIMEEHCSGCHAIQVLELNRKSRSDWEITLEKMEEFGLQLSQEEQAALLDYLESK
jgi:mono/diheme cytochrome c family protein